MKMPQQAKLFDVCEIHYHANDKSCTWHATHHFRIPAPMARFYTRTMKSAVKGAFFVFVPNGKNPITYLNEKKWQRLKKK